MKQPSKLLAGGRRSCLITLVGIKTVKESKLGRFLNRGLIPGTLGLLLGIGTACCQEATPTPVPDVLRIIQNAKCGYSLRLPVNSGLEKISECSLKITLPPIPGQDWIEEASLTLETSAAKDGVATEKPMDSEEPATGNLAAGGLRFEKWTREEAGAGRHFVTVEYNAIGKYHQYHFLGVMKAVDPGTLGKPIPHWKPARSAGKIFDGILLTFRPLE